MSAHPLNVNSNPGNSILPLLETCNNLPIEDEEDNFDVDPPPQCRNTPPSCSWGPTDHPLLTICVYVCLIV